MASQLSPAWQRKTASSNHLAKISVRFLSDGPQPEQRSDDCQVIPFLLDNPAQAWIPHDLCQVLGKRGHQIQILSTAPSKRLKENPLQPGTKQQILKDANFVLSTHPDRRIMLTSSTKGRLNETSS